MNHPTPEAWMTYLYGEAEENEQATLAAHLAVCPDCLARVEQWRTTLRALDRSKVHSAPPRRWSQPVLRWAAAAALVLIVGYGVGRASAPVAPDTTALRREMRAEFDRILRQEVARSASDTLAASTARSRELLREFARYSEQSRAADNLAFSAALTKLDAQRVADDAELRQDLETVAVVSDVGLRQARQGLVQLAEYQGPAATQPNPTSSGNP